jgi:hypothetical protein
MMHGRYHVPPVFRAVLVGLMLLSARASAQYVETNDCLDCHVNVQRQNDFCPPVAGRIWLEDDKHRRAFFLLHETDLSEPNKGAAKRELVQRILGFDLLDAFTDQRYVRLKDMADAETARKVATVKLCLRCHGTWPKEADASYTTAPPVRLEFGVSCQACHGPGEKWDQPHRIAAWRMVTPEAKAALGLADCRSPVAKAQLCASCHVGDVAQEKFVKHKWYAAGHPPLPGFELGTFQAQMPAHWKSLREKGPFLFRDGPPPDDFLVQEQRDRLVRLGVPADAMKRSYREANFPESQASGLDPCSDLAATKDAVIGGAVIAATYARLVGDYARAACDAKAAWPELAIYDCAACHHELRSGLAATSRPSRSHPPGRPPLAGWPMVLAPLAAVQTSDERWSAVSGPLVELERATTSRPFGDPSAIHAASQPLVTALKQLADNATNTRFDDAAARRLVQYLTGSSRSWPDYSGARQAAWSIREIARDLGHKEADALFTRGKDDPLALSLPSGPQRSVTENLHRWLPAAARYEAAWFHEELRAARTVLLPDGR